jgi:short-subunit dehydrogenase
VNENVVVLGAGGAAGQAIARQLAGRGVAVTVAGRHRASLAPLAGELGAAVIEADVCGGDLPGGV